MVLLPLGGFLRNSSRLQRQEQCAWPEGSSSSSSCLLLVILGICTNAGEESERCLRACVRHGRVPEVLTTIS